jgi:hypothetical protein
VDSRRQLQVIAEVVRVCDGAGIDIWLRGGWAMDFFLGEVTRPHADVDLFCPASDAERLIALLYPLGYRNAWFPGPDRTSPLALTAEPHDPLSPAVLDAPATVPAPAVDPAPAVVPAPPSVSAAAPTSVSAAVGASGSGSGSRSGPGSRSEPGDGAGSESGDGAGSGPGSRSESGEGAGSGRVMPDPGQQCDLVTPDGIEVSVAFLGWDGDGCPTVAGGPYAGSRWPADLLTWPPCRLGGVTCRIVSPRAQIEIKSMMPRWMPGLPRRDKDTWDVARLRAFLLDPRPRSLRSGVL